MSCSSSSGQLRSDISGYREVSLITRQLLRWLLILLAERMQDYENHNNSYLVFVKWARTEIGNGTIL